MSNHTYNTIMETTWADIPGFENLYQISIDGRVRVAPDARPRGRSRPGRELKVTIGSYGYRGVNLTVNYKAKRLLIHRLLMQVFGGGIAPGMDVDHIDGNRSNNAMSNLRVVTRSQNLMNSTACRAKTGIRGVSWSKHLRYYVATIGARGKVHHLGYFKSVADAAEARKLAEIRLWGQDRPEVVRAR